MKFLLDLAVISALMLAIFALSVFAQFEDEDTSSRHIGIGLAGGGGVSSVSGTIIVPYETDLWNVWFGGFIQQTAKDTEIQAQTVNLHVEPEYKFTERISINAYADALRDHVREIDGQVQVGGFVAYKVVDDADVELKIGAGNYLQNRSVQEDLEREATDPTTVHLLGYVKTRYRMISNVFRFTPELDFSNPAFELKPNANFAVSESWGVSLGGIIGYEHEADERTYWSYQIQGTYSF